jgi:hypothetical protein
MNSLKLIGDEKDKDNERKRRFGFQQMIGEP